MIVSDQIHDDKLSTSEFFLGGTGREALEKFWFWSIPIFSAVLFAAGGRTAAPALPAVLASLLAQLVLGSGVTVDR